MAMQITLPNILTWLSAASPFFISFFFLLESAFNSNWRFFPWVFGLLITQCLAMSLRATGMMKFSLRKYLRHVPSINIGQNRMNDLCSIFEDKFYPEFAAPSTHGVFHAYTLVYIILGVANNPIPQGIGFIVVLSLLMSMDFFWRTTKRGNCETWKDFGVGMLIGGAAGFGVWMLVYNLIDPTLVYFGKEDNMKKCKLGKQEFKCTYKKI